jgi:phosphatidylserine/phosphatidylglycerophosphate/cardiolipin synthase-like enzyme
LAKLHQHRFSSTANPFEGAAMGSIVLNVYCNTDDAFLVWKANKIEGCLGFAIEREWLATAVPGRDLNQPEYLLNRVGFEGDVEAGPHQQWTSDIAPFQRYNWTDHELTFGDRALYRIVPMVGKVGELVPKVAMASEWVPVDASQPPGGTLSCYFNRPMAASQWMARIAEERGIETSSGLVAAMEDVSNTELRDFCGGTLIVALRELFDRADADPAIALYAALFELRDAEIIDRFCRLGERAHIVLANGSPKVSEPDPNADGRAALRQAGCEVIDRMCATAGERGDLGHNKFIVVTRQEQAEGVWTGSTNLTPTGLFTQINNAIYIDQTALAEQYRTQWKRLADAQSEVPSTLKKSNAAPAKGIAAPVSVQPWFTPTVKQNDIARLKELVRNAKDGILFLAFMPGPTGPLIDILEERAEGQYVRGVVNQFVAGGNPGIKATLIGGSASDPLDLDVFNPDGIQRQFAFWAKEFSKGGRISVLVHSKVMCIDPFGDNPVVVTGSHNFSSAASESNDENFVVIEGDKALAKAYAAHIMSAYNHYRWRQYVNVTTLSGREPWQKLEDKPSWQDSRLPSARQQAEWEFWL